MTGVDMDRWAELLTWWIRHGSGTTSSLTGGGAIAVAEEALRRVVASEHAVLVSSGTAALRGVLVAAGVGRGDEVIVPAFDWPAAAASVQSVGATPVFADVDSTGTLDAGSVASNTSSSTRAVIATHLFGRPADIESIRAAVADRKICVIEDAAQALGASRDGRPVGSLGDAACFSFGPGKIIDAGEGGAITTSDPDLARGILMATQHPVRQQIGGVGAPVITALHARTHPVAAVAVAHGLEDLDRRLSSLRTARERTCVAVRALDLPGLKLVSPRPGVVHAPGPCWGTVPQGVPSGEMADSLSRVGVIAVPIGISQTVNATFGVDADVPLARMLTREAVAFSRVQR